jgi:uncharacterized protein (DUF433 family)
MSRVVNIRLTEEQVERLKQLAQRLGTSQSAAGALLIEEGLREAEFPLIEFRDSPVGRQAYLRGSTLSVWEVIMISQHLEMDAERTARYFDRPLEWAQTALRYYAAHAGEIDPAIDENRSMTYEKLKAMLPQLELLEIPREALTDEQT